MKKNIIFEIVGIVFIGMLFLAGISCQAEAVVTGFPIADWINLDVTLVNQEPDPVEPGQYIELRFKFENYGSENAEDVLVEILPDYPFSLDPGDQAFERIGSINGRQIGDDGAVVKYRLKVDEGAVEGENEIEIRYKINKEGYPANWIKPDPFDVDIQTHDAIISVDSVESYPSEFSPGSLGILNITIKNIADSVLKEIKAKLEVRETQATSASITTTEYPFSPIGSTNEKTVDYLAAKEETTIQFKLIADPDAEANVYKVPLTIEYSDELGENYSKNLILGLIIGEVPDLVVNLEDTTIIASGMEGTANIKFINKGTNNIKFCYVKLKESEDYKILSQKEIYIGKIDSDDYETAEFNLYLDSKKSEVLLPIEIEYKDANNKDYSDYVEVPLKMYSSSEAKRYGLKKGSSGVGAVIVLLIVAGGLFFYWRRKKSKSGKKK